MTTVTRSKQQGSPIENGRRALDRPPGNPAAEDACDEDDHEDDGHRERDPGHAEAIDRRLGEVEQISAPQHPDDGRRDEAADLCGARGESQRRRSGRPRRGAPPAAVGPADTG